MTCPVQNPERYKNSCGGCGRPVPAPCPYCQTCHCSLNCSLVTAGKSTRNEWTKVNKNRWLGIIAIALCILLILVIITLIICVWYYSDRWAVNRTHKDDDYQPAEPHSESKTESEAGTAASEDLKYDEYHYI